MIHVGTEVQIELQHSAQEIKSEAAHAPKTEQRIPSWQKYCTACIRSWFAAIAIHQIRPERSRLACIHADDLAVGHERPLLLVPASQRRKPLGPRKAT